MVVHGNMKRVESEDVFFFFRASVKVKVAEKSPTIVKCALRTQKKS